MKYIKLFEDHVAITCSSDLCSTVMPTLSRVTDMISHYTNKVGDLVKIQAEVNKMQKLVTDAIRAATPFTGEIDWDKAPKAPIFVLNLKDKYPQNEAKYYELWYRAATRQPVFSYGGAIMIFKTYCKRENLMLEDHDYDAEMPNEKIV